MYTTSVKGDSPGGSGIFDRFQTKLVLFLVTLITIAGIGIIYAVYKTITSNLVAKTKEELVVSERLLSAHLGNMTKNLGSDARALASDFGFREAVATEDKGTILSALENLKTRSGASRIMLVSLRKMILADTANFSAEKREFPLRKLMEEAEDKDTAVSIAVMDNSLYNIVITTVLAPTPIAWVALAVEMSDREAESIRKISPLPLDVTFMVINTNGEWETFSSTLNTRARASLSAFVTRNGLTGAPEHAYINGEEHVLLAKKLGARSAVVLHYSLDEAMKSYKPLIGWLIVIVAVGVACSIIGSVFVARGVTKPILTLADAAGRISRGEYGIPVVVRHKDEIGRLAQAFNHMMSGISEREEKIWRQARHDTLTGLPNRLMFEETLEKKIAENNNTGGFSVALIGIEPYTEIKNTLGHSTADMLIRRIGDKLRERAPEAEVTARLASEIFILLMPATVAPEEFAERILDIFEEPMELDGVTVDVTAHMGISEYPKHGMDAKTLMQHADVAMYIAHQTHGLKFTVYDQEKDPYSVGRLSLMGELKRGLEEKQLQLYYQPKIDLTTGRITHVEALARWIHPERGFMAPNMFIPMAEKTGHIQKLTEWALGEAVAQLAMWKRAGVPLKVAVNLSAKDLSNKKLPSLIEGLLANEGVAPGALVLEITESAIMNEPESAIEMLLLLKRMGMTLSVDDFGSGYSSMGYLKKLPVDELKIDMVFVLELATNPEDEVIVRSIVDLGHNLGLKVIAEGVENEESMNILRKHGCDMAQGYYYSRPLPPDKLAVWLAESKWGLES